MQNLNDTQIYIYIYKHTISRLDLTKPKNTIFFFIIFMHFKIKKHIKHHFILFYHKP